MQSLKISMFALILLFSTSCRSIWLGKSDSVVTPFVLIIPELMTLTAVTIAHKDSLSQWPQDRNELSSFYQMHQSSFLQDSLFKKHSFSEPRFESLNFLNKHDTLTISFISNLLPDFSTNSKPANRKQTYYKYFGTTSLYPDSLSQGQFAIDMKVENIIMFDSNKREIGNVFR